MAALKSSNSASTFETCGFAFSAARKESRLRHPPPLLGKSNTATGCHRHDRDVNICELPILKKENKCCCIFFPKKGNKPCPPALVRQAQPSARPPERDHQRKEKKHVGSTSSWAPKDSPMIWPISSPIAICSLISALMSATWSASSPP